jgi:transcriptional regulator with XRE-family HTH domain
MKNKRLEERRKSISPDIEIYLRQSFEIADRIHNILQDQNKDQKYLAEILGKKESEISKWLTGTHNFTIKTLAKIQVALGEKIFPTTTSHKKACPDLANFVRKEFFLMVKAKSSEMPHNLRHQ